MRDVYLIMVTASENHNKFYQMKVVDDAHFEATYGRVGAKGMKRRYSANLFDTKYNEKIKKGYVDVTDLHGKTQEMKKLCLADKNCEEFLNFILEESNHILRKNYSVAADRVTEDMIKQAEQILSSIDPKQSMEINNERLLSTFLILPRRMENVDCYLIHKESDYQKVLRREYELLDIMKARILTRQAAGESDGIDFLKKNHIELRPVSKGEEAQIKKHMGSESSDLYYRAFRVRNLDTDMRFYQFMDKNGYGEKDIHYLYHGSRNANIWGLASLGVSLAPKNVVITGKMFGNGIYFANRAKKSIGYASLTQSYWNNERSDRGFLLVYKVLYKRPLDVTSPGNFSASNICPHDAVFAHKGTYLYNDEIIIYNESQVTLQYVIELR